MRLLWAKVAPVYRQRPYRNEYTGSLPNSEVNRCRARSVLGWGTAWEALWVLLAFLLIHGGWQKAYYQCFYPCWCCRKIQSHTFQTFGIRALNLVMLRVFTLSRPPGLTFFLLRLFNTVTAWWTREFQNHENWTLLCLQLDLLAYFLIFPYGIHLPDFFLRYGKC